MQRACCTRAEVYGALLHASVFSHKEIRLSAENMTVVRRLQALLQRAFFVECEPQKAGRKAAACAHRTGADRTRV